MVELEESGEVVNMEKKGIATLVDMEWAIIIFYVICNNQNK